jgi:GDP-L-fucose synthase
MRVLLTGGNGMLGTSIVAAWQVTMPEHTGELTAATRRDADLRDLPAVRALIARVNPDVVLHTAARVGGISANIADPVGFMMDNLRIDSSVLTASLEHGVRKLIYFGSSCMYPKDYRQPLVESDVLAAPLEPTNEGYALSKISSARFCGYVARQFGHAWRVLIPSNLYGPNDDYSLGNAHLVAATIAKAHQAKVTGATSIDVWGDGTARREFTYVGDLANWVITHLSEMESWPELMNVGQGEDRTVLDYYRAALETVGYACDLITDPTKPAGMQQKLMDSSLARGHGWDPRTSLHDGMRASYERYLNSLAEATVTV